MKKIIKSPLYCPNCGMKLGDASKNCCIHCGYTMQNTNNTNSTNTE